MIHHLAPGACPQCHAHDDDSCTECHPPLCTVCGVNETHGGQWLCAGCEESLWPPRPTS